MTATAAATPTARTLRVLWSARPLDTTIVAVRVNDKGNEDTYHAFHTDDSTEVEWVHDDEPTRSYRVVCSVSTHLPTACTCKGWQFGRGRHCRHMAATRVLVERGVVELPRLGGYDGDRGGCE